MVKTGIYMLKNTLNNHLYIGSTASLGFRRRWSNHVCRLNKGSHHSAYLQNAWNKYGEAAFIFEVLELCPPEKCLEREQWYLDTLKPEYNVLRIAGNVLGLRHPTGKPAHNAGKPAPWISESNKKRVGVKLTDDHKQKIGLANKGRKRPDLSERNRQRSRSS